METPFNTLSAHYTTLKHSIDDDDDPNAKRKKENSTQEKTTHCSVEAMESHKKVFSSVRQIPLIELTTQLNEEILEKTQKKFMQEAIKNLFTLYLKNEADFNNLNWDEINLSSESFNAIKAFLLQGIPFPILDENTVKQYLILAYFSQVDSIKYVCEEWISHYRGWSEDNVSEFYQLGAKYHNDVWMSSALQFAAYHFVVHKKLREFIFEHAREVKELRFSYDEQSLPRFPNRWIETINNAFFKLKKLVILGFNFDQKKLNEFTLSNLEELEINPMGDYVGNYYKSCFIGRHPKLKVLKINFLDDRLPSTLLTHMRTALAFKKTRNLSELKTVIINFSNRKKYDFKIHENFLQPSHLEILGPLDNVINFREHLVNKLEYLNAPINLQVDKIPVNLKHLHVNCSHELFVALPSLTQLESLCIDSTCEGFNVKKAAIVSKLPKLKKLMLGPKVVLSAASAEYIANISTLESFSYFSTFYYNDWLKLFFNAKDNKFDQIQSIEMAQSSTILLESLSLLKKLKNLKKLHIYTNDKTTQEDLIPVMEFSNLTELKFFSSKHPKFNELRFYTEKYDSISVSSDFVLQIFTKLPHLREFHSKKFTNSQGYWEISSDGTEDLSFAKKIKKLIFNGFDLSKFTKGALTHLEELNFSGPSNILLCILGQARKLKKLKINSIELTPNLKWCIENLNSLEILTLDRIDDNFDDWILTLKCSFVFIPKIEIPMQEKLIKNKPEHMQIIIGNDQNKNYIKGLIEQYRAI
jgi:hypothetical protein